MTTSPTVSDAVKEGRRAAVSLADSAKSAASDVADAAKDRAEAIGEAGKDKAAGRLDRVADALSATSRELPGKEAWLAEAIDSASRHLRSASAHLHEQDVEGLARETSEFARRHPAAFMGAAVALGFGLGRVAKASTGGREERPDESKREGDRT